VDTFITEVSQDTWIYFPWDLGLSFQAPIAGRGRGDNHLKRAALLRVAAMILPVWPSRICESNILESMIRLTGPWSGVVYCSTLS